MKQNKYFYLKEKLTYLALFKKNVKKFDISFNQIVHCS